ncbi:hypothetical protein HJC23_012895 [Cyclotella cryptica]|uniref:Glycosyltransferase family 92 protein n=1 Tax=Cyclotella cryptica TaxID=29204 RepID=A0ABD3Q1I7_9STRA|eukprot:CCRYP_009486-RA/>CCRYP_009486-RA protein AED:0.00 eAED:0.00 QI:240/-1/1/1/-1/1/1/164/333
MHILSPSYVQICVACLLVLLFSCQSLNVRYFLIGEEGKLMYVNYDASTSYDGGIQAYAPSNYTSNVAMCLIVKNETIYMDEWVDFHVALGFSPIYIYDNMLAPDLELALWYEKRKDLHKHVRIIHFPITPVQVPAYDMCIKEDAKNSTFIALFDIDEFLVLKKHNNVIDFMEEHCQEPKCGQLSVNWLMMGTSNETVYQPVPVTKRNVHTDGMWGTIKTIVRPTYVDDNIGWRHSVYLKKGYWLDTRGNIINNKGWKRQANNEGPSDVALLHHYSYKSEEEWNYKNCIRGSSLQNRLDKPSLCHRKILVGGKFFNDDAWQQLKRMVPGKYGAF